MKVNKYGVVILSRRNLLSLLHKLDMPGSQRTLIGPGRCVVVMAEDDDEHYKDRGVVGPGKMHPETEEFIKRHGRKASEVQEEPKVSAPSFGGIDAPRSDEAGAAHAREDFGPIADF